MSASAVSVSWKDFEGLIEEACHKHPTSDAAVVFAMKKLRGFPELFDFVADNLIERAVRSALNDRRHHVVTQLKKASPGKCVRGMVAVEIAGRALPHGLLSAMTLSMGVRLGDATVDELLKEAKLCREQADGLIKKAKFLESIAKNMAHHPKGSKVQKFYTDSDLKKLWDSI